MKDYDAAILFIFVAIIAGILFFSVVTGVKKAFNRPPNPGKINSSQMLREQKRRMDDTRYQQKRMMQDQKQKIRDLSR